MINIPTIFSIFIFVLPLLSVNITSLLKSSRRQVYASYNNQTDVSSGFTHFSRKLNWGFKVDPNADCC